MRPSPRTPPLAPALAGALLAAALAASGAGCGDPGRSVFLSTGETKCFTDYPRLCVTLRNVETEGHCDFDVVTPAATAGEYTPVANFQRVNERSRVDVAFDGQRYQIEVADTTERVFSPDEARFEILPPP